MVGRPTEAPVERMSGPHSLGSSYRYSSQSRKISIGVLADSIAKAEKKEALMQIGGNAPGKGGCVNECGGFTPLVERNVNLLNQETSPWVSTRNGRQRDSYSIAAHDVQWAPIAASTGQLGSKKPVKASVNGECGTEADNCIQKNFRSDAFPVEVAVVDDANNENNGISVTKPKASEVKEQLEEENGKIVNDGRESLKLKLWDILENVSTPNKCIHSSPFDKLHSGQEGDEKEHSSLRKRLQFSDTIESDSERPDYGSKRPVLRSLPIKKASTNPRDKIVDAKPNSPVKKCPNERVFTFREECTGALVNGEDGSLCSKKQKSERESYCVKKNQLQRHKCTERRQQPSNRSKLKPSNASTVHKSKAQKVAVSKSRRNNTSIAVNSGARKKISPKCPTKIVTDLQKDDQQPREVETPELINGNEYIKDSLLKNKRNILDDAPVTTFEAKEPGSPPARCHNPCPAEQLDGRYKKRSNVDFVKPSFFSEDDSGNGKLVPSVYATDLEREEDNSPAEDCRESEPLSPEICLIKKFVCGGESVKNQKIDISFTPGPETVKETRIEDTGDLGTYTEQNNEDGLSNAVELLALALNRIEAKLKSMTSKRSAEILQATAEKISSQLQAAKSRIKLDVEKLTIHDQPKKKILETRFEEQRDQLIKVYEDFKKEFDQQLQCYDNIFGDLENHEIELKRTAEKHRAGHKRLLLEVEQEITVHLNDAESRIIAVHKLAKERLLQLKLALAKFVEDDALMS